MLKPEDMCMLDIVVEEHPIRLREHSEDADFCGLVVIGGDEGDVMFTLPGAFN